MSSMEGGCHNAYLLAKLKVSYEEIKKDIEKVAAKKKTGSKSADSLAPVLEKLSYFTPDLGLLPHFLEFLEFEDPKILRRVYSTLLTLGPLHNERSSQMNLILTRFAQLQTRFNAESQAHGLRSVFSMLAFSAFDYTLTGKPLTAEKIKALIHLDDTEADTADAKTKEKKKAPLKIKFMSKKVDDSGQEAYVILAGYLFILRAYLKDQVTSKEVKSLINALKLPHSSLPAQALATLQWVAKHTPALIKEPMASFLMEEEQHIHFTDPRARATLAWICGEFSDNIDTYRFHLYSLIMDENVRVSIAAMSALLKGKWSSLMREFTPKKGGPAEPIFRAVGNRLKDLVGSDDNPTVHAACRLMGILAEKYITYFYNEVREKDRARQEFHASGERHPLFFLQQRLYQLLEKGNVPSFIRLKILQALIWLSYAEDTEMLEKIIITSIAALPAELFNLILEELRRRISALTTTDFSDTTLHLFHSIFKTSPNKINPEMLTSVWTTIMQFGEAGRNKVLNSITAFTDTLATSAPVQFTLAYTALKKAIFWFLGEYGNVLTNERLEHSDIKDTPRGASPRKSSTKTSEKDKDDGKDHKHKESKDKDSKDKKSESKEDKKEKRSLKEKEAEKSSDPSSSSPPSSARQPLLRPSNSVHQLVPSGSPPLTPKTSASDPTTAPTPATANSASPAHRAMLAKRSQTINPSSQTHHATAEPAKSLPSGAHKINLERVKTLSGEDSRHITQRDVLSAGGPSPYSTMSTYGMGGTRSLLKGSHGPSFGSAPIGGKGLAFPVAQERRHYGVSGYTFLELTPNFVEKEMQRGLGHFEDLGGIGNTDGAPFKLPSVGNLFLEQVLIRIEYALGFSEWEVRLTCLEALAKIAFRSSYRVKLHIYSFLQLILRDNSMALSSDVLPIFNTLQKVFTTYETLREKNKNSCDPTEAKSLREAIRRHCAFEDDVDPVFGKIKA